ncbi:MAG: YoaK family protein [Myxococcales bacterium]|nr:YoaK family protein [Myxococcales bacterium]
MLKRHAPGWVYAGGLLLTAAAGCVNAVALGSAYHAVTHMTGTVFAVSLEFSQGHTDVALRAAAVVASFFMGAVLSGAIVQQSSLHAGRRYGVALMLEGLILGGAWFGLTRQSVAGEVLAAIACGLQNALATSYSGAVVRTTHMTGVVTDLGIAVGHWLARQPIEWLRIRILLVLLLGFTSGGSLGALAFPVLGASTLLIPAGALFVAGLAYTIQRQRQRLAHVEQPRA